MSKWFALGLYDGWPKMSLKCNSRHIFCGDGSRAAHGGGSALPPTGSGLLGGGRGSTRITCDGADASVEQGTFLAIGITSASSEAGHERRRASRQTWARSHAGVLACFLLSSRGPAGPTGPEALQALRREARRQRDMLFFDVAETATLSPSQAKLAGFKKRYATGDQAPDP